MIGFLKILGMYPTQWKWYRKLKGGKWYLIGMDVWFTAYIWERDEPISPFIKIIKIEDYTNNTN